ncbi:MAG: toxin HicA [Oscillospiraceae bacterium]|nr:toxin HicA [Oscillospiraceae bacterium]
MAQWEKLIEQILRLNKSLRYEDLSKALKTIGYEARQPGGSHVTFRKTGKMPITIPKGNPVNKAYIELVRDAVIVSEGEDKE